MKDIIEELRAGAELEESYDADGIIRIGYQRSLRWRAADEIERLRHENDALRNGLDGADRLSNAFAETARRRGARMQKMWEWMHGGDGLEHVYFISEHPEAAEWFDEDGVPK